MKNLLLLFLAALTTLPLSAFTYTHEGYSLIYNVIDDDARTCEVVGPLNNWSDPIAGDLVIPTSAKYGAVSYEVVSIGENSFYNCSKLTSVDIPNTVTTIKSNAFFGCYNLEPIVIPKSVTSIAGSAYGNCFYTKEVIFNAENCTECMSPFPQTIEKLTIGDEVKTIPSGAFLVSMRLKTVEIPNSVITIGENAFSGCNVLESVVIGSGMESIRGYAFDKCTKIGAIYLTAEQPPVAADNVFIGPVYKNATLYVPAGTGEAYKSAPCWGKFSKIVETEPSGIGEIVADNESVGFDSALPYEVFNLSGMRVNGSIENLSQGIYIIRQGRYVKKIAVN